MNTLAKVGVSSQSLYYVMLCLITWRVVEPLLPFGKRGFFLVFFFIRRDKAKLFCNRMICG